MDWSAELTRWAAHAAAAAVVVALLLLGPGRRLVARVADVVGGAKRMHVVLLAVALTLGVRLALMPAVHVVHATDVKEYVEKADAIAREGHPRSQETRADGTVFHRTLGYSLPLAGWYRVTGIPETPTGRVRSAQVFNLLTAAATTALLVLLGAAVGRETAGRLAALGHALFLPAAMFALLPYTETWTTLLVVTSLLFFARACRDGAATTTWAAALGLAQGLLLITRFEFAWMPLVLAGFLLVRKRARAMAGVAAMAALAVVPLAVNHALRAGYPGTLRTSVQSGLILYFGNNPIEVTGYGNAPQPVVDRVQALYADDPTGGTARDAALAWMRENPHLVAANVPKKLHHLWLAAPQGFTWQIAAGVPGGTDRTLASVLLHLGWVQSLALLALGVAGLVRERRAFAPWTLVLALHAATWALLAASPRNRYPLEPLLMTAAASWLVTRAARGTARG